jgi:hypothetical protein
LAVAEYPLMLVTTTGVAAEHAPVLIGSSILRPSGVRYSYTPTWAAIRKRCCEGCCRWSIRHALQGTGRPGGHPETTDGVSVGKQATGVLPVCTMAQQAAHTASCAAYAAIVARSPKGTSWSYRPRRCANAVLRSIWTVPSPGPTGLLRESLRRHPPLFDTCVSLYKACRRAWAYFLPLTIVASRRCDRGGQGLACNQGGTGRHVAMEANANRRCPACGRAGHRRFGVSSGRAVPASP